MTSLDAWNQVADVKVGVAIDNEHGSTLYFDNVDYDVSLGGNHVASGVFDTLGGVEGATEKIVEMPIQVDLLQAGTSVYEALAGLGNLRVGLQATMDVSTPFGVLPLSVDEKGDVEVQGP